MATYEFIMACIDTGQSLFHTEKQGFGYLWLSKKFKTYPSPISEKLAYPCKTMYAFFFAHLYFREFWPH